MIPIWVVDDHAVIRQGLKQIIQTQSEILRVTAEASSAQELFERLKTQTPPHAIILDLSLAGKGGLEILEDLKTYWAHIPVLVLSMHPEDQYALRALRSGASGYLTKECAPEQLAQALMTIIRGEKYITSKVAHLLARHLSSPQDDQPPHEKLSDREFRILVDIAHGKTLTEISGALDLSVKTVSTYRARVLKKLGKRTNADLIQYALQHQLVPVDQN